MLTGNDLKLEVVRKGALLRSEEEKLKRLINRKMEVEEEIRLLEGASDLLLQVGAEQQEAVISFLNTIVTKGIQDIWGEQIVIEFRESTRANQRAIDVIQLKDGNEVDIPDGVGGGLGQMVSLLVQLTFIYLRRRDVRQVAILDESLSFLADIYVPAAAKVLKEVSSSLGIQIIAVTHQEQLAEAADVVYSLTYDDKGTKIALAEF